jgi:hypothetical protein
MAAFMVTTDPAIRRDDPAIRRDRQGQRVVDCRQFNYRSFIDFNFNIAY